MTPSPSEAEALPFADADRRFALIASSACTGRFLGVPFFRPSLPAEALFNVWAFLLGPFAFFAFGLWRKGLVLLGAGAFIFVPTLLPTDVSPLASILREAYTPFPQALQALSLTFVALWCRGRRWWATLTGLAFAGLFIAGDLHVPPLDFKPGSGFVWLNAPMFWNALLQAEAFSLLAGRWAAALVFPLLGAAFWYGGVPLYLFLYALPAVFYPLFCGMMATYDLYRKKVLHEVFWW